MAVTLRRILSNNNIGGTIPPELGSMVNLRQLCVLTFASIWQSCAAGEGIGAAQPDSHQDGALSCRFLDNNNLTGTIPPELGRLRGLLNSTLCALVAADAHSLRVLCGHALLDVCQLTAVPFPQFSPFELVERDHPGHPGQPVQPPATVRTLREEQCSSVVVRCMLAPSIALAG